MPRISDRTGWFLAFSAVFAALVGYVFWGTWSPDMAPVMPDAWTTYPATLLADQLRGFWESGRFIPDDLKVFLGGPWVWQELQYAFAIYFAALGVVYYCRGRGLSRPASYGAALLLAFSGYWLTLYSAGHLGWFRWMTYGVFAFGLADRAVRKGKLRHWLLLGADVAWASFNQQDMWLLFTVFTAAYFLWCCVRERKLPWRGVLVAGLVFAAVGAPNFVSSLGETLKVRKEQIERGENITGGGASDAEKRWEFVTNWSMPPEDALEFLVPRVHGDTSCPFVLSINRVKGVKQYTGALGRPMNASKGNYRQHSLYVGWATCLLALVGLVSIFIGRRGTGDAKPACLNDAVFFAVAAAVFFALSLGRYFAPAYRIVFALPFGDLIRCPVKWHHLTELSLAFLAAFGIDAVLRFAVAKGLRRVMAVGVVAGVVLLGAFGLASNAKLYCAPYSIKEARRAGLKAEMTVLSRADFAKPQVAELMRVGRIVSLANYMGHPDYFLVEMLRPFDSPARRSPGPTTVALGLMSILTTLGVLAFCGFMVVREPRRSGKDSETT
ncbi:MAG: hypothetical protein IJH50_01695 [Kiritimatiellae bacterium]|nr:hypothetical protein [Kiritimatiellia bacterium]